nr:hypothetical protein [Tanacetum cinerariifolium]
MGDCTWIARIHPKCHMGLVKDVRSTWGVRVYVKGRIGYGRVQGRLHWLDCLRKMPVDLAFDVDFQSCVRYCLKMVKSSSSSKNEVFDDTFCSTSCKKNTESLNTKITEFSKKLSDGKTMLYHYKLGLSHVEARLVEFKNQEIKFCEKIRGLEFKVESKDTGIERLTKELEKLKKEKEGLESKLTGFESTAKYLDTLLQSHRSDKNKEGLGYSDSPKIIKTTKGETARKPPVRYAEMYRNTSKSLKDEPPNKFNRPHPKRTFVPAAILTKTGHIPVNAAKQSSHKEASSVSAARRVSTAAPRPNMNSARPKTTQDLMNIKLIQRVKRLEMELKARTPPTNIHYVEGQKETEVQKVKKWLITSSKSRYSS